MLVLRYGDGERGVRLSDISNMDPESNDFDSFVDDCHHRKQKMMKKTVCDIPSIVLGLMKLGV